MSTTRADEELPDRFARIVADPPRSARTSRYRGDDRAVRLGIMNESDRASVLALYGMLRELDGNLRTYKVDTPELASETARAFDVDAALSHARKLGVSAGLAEDLRQALHDVRGGALSSLLLEIQRARRRNGVGSIRALRILTSDHLKVMRNAVLELDDVRRVADLVPTPHAIERLEETLMQVTGDGSRGAVEVDMHRSFTGVITMSCLELGALDRAALNLVNNAVRHSASGRVELALVAAANRDLRVCVANAIDPAHATALRERFGSSLDRIFLDKFSTSGSGEGLKICIDFVAAAYGLVQREDVIASRLVGALVDDGWFVAWMHWPVVA